MEKEIWKELRFNNNYLVSNYGRIKNRNTGNLRRININKDGYCFVTLPYPIGHEKRNRSNRKYITIHRAVAEAFLEPIEGKEYVDHIDHNKTNNCVWNLRWASAIDNSNNRKHKYNGGHSGIPTPVEKWDKDRTYMIAEYPSVEEAVRQNDTSSSRVWDCIYGLSNTAGGFWWKIKD